MIHIVGGGLAGSEAAWQAAMLGVPVTLYEMRPVRPTAVHKTDGLAELVCSNSFRGDKLDNAVGLLKEEMRRLGSLVMRAADVARVPAGAALAVDRETFSAEVTRAIASHPLIRIRREEVARIPSVAGPLIIATGPLTSESLSADIAALVGATHLYFYDAVSPIVLAESIDRSKVYRASRWGRSMKARVGSSIPSPASDSANEPAADGGTPPSCGVDDGEGDYLNCPFTAEEYARFYEALISAEQAPLHEFDDPKFFEGCLPIEVMASRGVDTLRFGPMKPVGLPDPRTGREPYAVVQLRQDNLAASHYSLVGFQTQMKWGEQGRVLRLIPGLENAEFVRFGMIHRNTYINGPTVLRETWQMKGRDSILFAGQISGVEGYVESAASGLIAGRNAAALALGREPSAPPRTTAIGALAYYVSHAEPKHYQPSNITFGIMPPLVRAPGGPKVPKKKADRNEMLSRRALEDLAAWMQSREREPVPR
ncbi:MAG TPA: methylenetetrahydrofolate--tRNA-(uracil(54)-C(5))-methyltransferase (FADH(2)-oxidizing) TrmFO [Vicinamibacterales bacterium]|nr:methylenetetrahydrofolate--tRNA-(uracil(54)-C(5))-methyltransferase (FADH(2)-oxidizing) TrmFO [Vicinamibacterales bacterium]